LVVLFRRKGEKDGLAFFSNTKSGGERRWKAYEGTGWSVGASTGSVRKGGEVDNRQRICVTACWRTEKGESVMRWSEMKGWGSGEVFELKFSQGGGKEVVLGGVCLRVGGLHPGINQLTKGKDKGGATASGKNGTGVGYGRKGVF